MLLKFSKILVAVLTVILVGLIIYIVVKKPPTQNSGEIKNETFTHSSISGFEGIYPETTITLDYNPETLSIRSFLSKILIRDLASDKIGLMVAINNDGPGFASPEEAFAALHQCDLCKPANLDTKINGAADTKVFSNDEYIWYIFSHDPGFFLIKIPKSSSEIKKILASLSITNKVTHTMPEIAKLKVYFANEKVKPIKDCTEVVPVERYYTKTPQVATVATLMLLDGPLSGEIDDGYATTIPEGAWLNSIKVENGVASVDFSKKIEEGGGSCSMTARQAQIEQTLLQFPTVKSVKISVEGRTEDIFQP